MIMTDSVLIAAWAVYIINSVRNCISSKRSFVYHHCESFLIHAMRDDIQPDGWWYTPIACYRWWYAIAFAMDKKTDKLLLVCFLVGEGGFEPPKSLTTDLQSAPFGRSGILPYMKMELVDGLEPPTCWLQISCSTNWATEAKLATWMGLEPTTSSVTG